MAKDNRALYEVTVNGTVRTLLLAPEDAEKYETAKRVDPKTGPANKSRGGK